VSSDERRERTGKNMKRKITFLTLCSMLLALCFPVHAQQAKSAPRIGYLSRDLHPADSRAATPRNLEAFLQGLQQLGYTEAKNIIIEYRYADGRSERMPALAEELARLKVEVIVADSIASVRAAKKATSTIPIVMASVGDPIVAGLVTSLAQPGGNLTGTTDYNAALLGKRLELLKEIVPKVSRFAFLNDVSSDTSKPMFKDGQAAAQALGVKLQLVEVKLPDPDLEGAFRVMVKQRIGALITGSGTLGSSLYRKKILALVEQASMPAIYTTEPWIEAGGLMYYGANDPDLFRRAAIYVDKILKGARPADLPVEQPMKFDFGINLKAAKQIGLTIPQSVLFRADRVIK
jgi:putative tryptophan/tyrosine transport system substrate-binding protein